MCEFQESLLSNTAPKYLILSTLDIIRLLMLCTVFNYLYTNLDDIYIHIIQDRKHLKNNI